MKKSISVLPILTLSSAALLMSCGGTATSSTAGTSSAASTATSSAVAESSEAVSSTEEASTAVIAESYITSQLSAGSYGDSSWNALAYQLDLYDTGVYRYTTTTLMYGYSMILGTTATVNYGTFVKGDTEDGVTAITLNAAAEVLLNSYSKAGGFSIVVTTPNQEYPVELPAKTQGEKNMAQSKADVLDQYGAGAKVWVESDTYRLSFADPETDEVPAAVTTASGDVSSVIKNISKFQIVNEFDATIKEAVNEETSEVTKEMTAWTGNVHMATIYEDNSYDYFKSTIRYGYHMLLATTSVNTIGTATVGSSEDGYTKVTLGEADEVLLNSFSKAGGFNIQVNTVDQEYPVELPAQAQGEQNMAQSKDDVIAAYGQSVNFWLSDDSGTMSVTDPNAE
ncbi:MAG: hypothetical protein K6F32_03435 [Bacilli bacterium]|nr:hypothetical protein [Bacilli bacterium]